EGALEMLKNYDGARPLAGGTDLLVSIGNRKISPRYLVDLKRISELDYIGPDDDELEIGALASLNSISSSKLVKQNAPVLADAAATVGSWQIRNWATLGGNLCNAAPSADTATALLVLNALAKFQNAEGHQVTPFSQFFTGPGATVMGQSGILTAVGLPSSSRQGKAVYMKYGLRKSMDIAVVGVAVWLKLEEKFCLEARVALGAVAPTPMRAPEAEAALQGKELSTEVIDRAALLASKECRPISDLRASADYRCELVRVLTKRGLNALISGTKGDGCGQVSH
ncbi:MAG: FAD binding domain-containing protein, partial [Chloroflexi bacterium]|nr:FAD binding domain-containing protein [Chloroflexota bacterium]